MKRQIHAYQRPRRDRGRGPQHQARARRHPRDRVLRADPAADRRRPASASCAAARRCRRSTTLAEGGWIGREAAHDLAAAYRFLRMVEHRLQMVADEQTHTLPAEREGARAVRALSRLCRTATRFADALLEHLRKVQRHYARLFEDAPAAEASRRALAFPPDKDDDRERSTGSPRWASAGRSRSSAAVRRWLAGDYRSLKSEFARTQLAELVPVLLDQLARVGKSRRARSSRSTGSSPGCMRGARLFSLLRQQSRSGRAGRARRSAPRRGSPTSWRVHPQVMDALIEPAFFGALPDEDEARRPSSPRSLAQARGLRGFARSRAPVRPGADVPDRRAHPVRHGVGRAGGRGLRAARRRADPRAASRGRGRISPQRTAACAASRARCSRSASSAAAR